MSEITVTLPPALGEVRVTLPDGSVLPVDAGPLVAPVLVQPPGVVGPRGEKGQDAPAPAFRLAGEVLEYQLAGETSWHPLGNVRGERGEAGVVGPAGARGEAGATGPQGVGIQTAALTPEGHLTLTLTTGQTVDVGRVRGVDGEAGPSGADGVDGVGITNAAVNAEGKLLLTLTTGLTLDAGVVRGADGAQGEPGADSTVPGPPGPAGADAPQRVFVQAEQPTAPAPWVWYKTLQNGEIELYVND